MLYDIKHRRIIHCVHAIHNDIRTEYIIYIIIHITIYILTIVASHVAKQNHMRKITRIAEIQVKETTKSDLISRSLCLVRIPIIPNSAMRISQCVVCMHGPKRSAHQDNAQMEPHMK